VVERYRRRLTTGWVRLGVPALREKTGPSVDVTTVASIPGSVNVVDQMARFHTFASGSFMYILVPGYGVFEPT